MFRLTVRKNVLFLEIESIIMKIICRIFTKRFTEKILSYTAENLIFLYSYVSRSQQISQSVMCTLVVCCAAIIMIEKSVSYDKMWHFPDILLQ